MKNIIMEKIKEVLIEEELNNNLIDKSYTEFLLANHSSAISSIKNSLKDVGYICSVKDAVYEEIVNDDDCGESVIELVKSSNGSLTLGELSFRDISINVVADHPSKSDGVDVSISFEVSYQGSFVETLTPAIIPGEAKELKEYLLLLALLLQDQVDEVY